MRVYFLAEKPCALRLGGAYLGLVDGFERSVELDLSDNILCELAPLDGFLPLSFRLNEDFLLSPPPQIALYFTDDALALFASDFLRADQSLRVVGQKRFGDALLTLTVQGRVQLHLQTPGGFFVLPLPDCLENAEYEPCGEHFLLRAENAFALVSREGELVLFSEGKVLSSNGTLRAEVPYHDSLGHSAVCEWQGGELLSCSVRSRCEPTAATFALALFESALLGCDLTPYLHESLAGKADRLKEYLGNYLSVALTSDEDRVGLVYKRKERVFDVRYFRITMQDGKIANIAPDP